MLDDEEQPIRTGLIALVGVGVAVGIIVGITVLIGTKMLGIGGDAVASDSGAGQTLYLPRPQRTTAASGPLITLAPGEPTPTFSFTDEPTSSTTTAPPKSGISLSASQVEVNSFEQIDLTGVYVGGEGAILQVQRLEGGTWEDFPVTVSVSDETFSTYVQTSRPGVNEFRVIDLDTHRKSNSVRVRVAG